MEDRSFDAVSRRVAVGAAGRRAVLALGAAGILATLMGPFAEARGNKNRNRNPNKRKRVRKQRQTCPEEPNLCAAQVQPCVDLLTAQCNGELSCQDVPACCSALGVCDFAGFLSCVSAAGRNRANQ